MSKEFWDSIHSFPAGLYCKEYSPAYWVQKKGPKDCASCTYLKLGRCSINKIPTLKEIKS